MPRIAFLASHADGAQQALADLVAAHDQHVGIGMAPWASRCTA
jgi:hypothetical protein